MTHEDAQQLIAAVHGLELAVAYGGAALTLLLAFALGRITGAIERIGK